MRVLHERGFSALTAGDRPVSQGSRSRRRPSTSTTDFGLSMAVITEDFRSMRFLRDECEFGMGYVNLPCIGAEVHLPFGGVKKSGNGHPSAAGLVEAVTHKVAWTVNHGLEIKMAQGLTADVD